MSDEVDIANLLYRYAELIDAGDFDGAADLFAEADLVLATGAPPVDAATMLGIWHENVIVYGDGTPRTRHVVTNPIIEVAEDGTAACRSVYTVLQQVDGRGLTPIVSGRYHDEFARVDGVWRFSRRDYSLVDLVGDLSAHLRMEL